MNEYNKVLDEVLEDVKKKKHEKRKSALLSLLQERKRHLDSIAEIDLKIESAKNGNWAKLVSTYEFELEAE